MPARIITAGEIIFKEGEPSDFAYFIQQGSVEITKKASHGDVVLATLQTGAVFGEMGVLLPDHAPRSASARALSDGQLFAIGQDELQQMLTQCPEPLLTIIKSAFERLRATNQRMAEREAARVDLPCDFEKIHILPESDIFGSVLTEHILTLGQLPYVIGGYAENNPASRIRSSGLLSLPCEGPPLMISKRHVGIEIQEKSVFLVDRGSRFGTIVNGRAIGKGKGLYKIPLQRGEYQLQFGDVHSPYRLKIQCV